MDSIIGLKQANCKNCYKCIRNCPVKSIAYEDGRVRIISDECIYCGKCLLICPQNAKYINSDLDKIKNAIKNGEKLYVSLAPSYVSAFPHSDILKMSAALKKLGFTFIEETAVGAGQVTNEYGKLIEEHKMTNIITTACPSVNMLVERHYPELLSQLAPVVTPVIAHARMLKQIYGVRIKVVFIGPCISKKYECIDPENNKSLFAALTFNELEAWLKNENIEIKETDKYARSIVNTKLRLYPITGGIIRNITPELRNKYECISVDGADRCIETLETLKTGNYSGYLFEMNICEGGCLGGPSFKMMNQSYLTAKSKFYTSSKNELAAPKSLTENVKIQLAKTFKNRKKQNIEVSEEKIKKILCDMGKAIPEKELNCGCCGYNSCRDKAKAVALVKADINMCLPHMRELAESMSNTVVEHSPIGVIILNEKLVIDHINPSAVELLKPEHDLKGHTITSILDSNDFYESLSEKKNVINKKVYYKSLDKYVSQTVLWVEENHIIIVLLNDITADEKMNEERRKFAEKSAAFANDVVNQQIKVVQQIANLLGETTVSTKTALNELTEKLLDSEKRQR